ncbi:cold shock domain-containing protein [Rarobacter faecitabidus]|uniref:Putative cold-shock DNA-binding protein n=1 Tax=Rarobacter faecitabidus TaxID=13243 RepID=A0A542ZTW5_RARFA|nr:cold shock domain-containing protein [Rarobacter faecitabidus]TQL63719.1 putative cold-shock DNA-binding protein [Rarobacter faecitabidus]
MPTGKVKFFDVERGFGFITTDDGTRVYLHADALPDGVTNLRKGARVEFSMADGRRGRQALTVRLLDPKAAYVRTSRKSADEMATIVEDLIKLLDEAGAKLRHGRYPDRESSERTAAVLRRVADEFEG